MALTISGLRRLRMKESNQLKYFRDKSLLTGYELIDTSSARPQPREFETGLRALLRGWDRGHRPLAQSLALGLFSVE